VGFAATPSQTVGPFFWIGLCERPCSKVFPDGDVRVSGCVLDGAGEPLPDAMVEVWQADADSVYRRDSGWGRSATDEKGRFSFTTVKPGRVAGQSPHLEMLVFARGLLKPVLTRMYFPDEDNDADPVLASVDPERRATLVAAIEDGGLRFDVHLQGDQETVFFAV
jgi:protocatechuate 3,4-dioxygenase alpha subunit